MSGENLERVSPFYFLSSMDLGNLAIKNRALVPWCAIKSHTKAPRHGLELRLQAILELQLLFFQAKKIHFIQEYLFFIIFSFRNINFSVPRSLQFSDFPSSFLTKQVFIHSH